MPKRFEIILSRQAARYYEKIPVPVARRLDRAFLLLEDDPIAGGDIKQMSGKETRFRLRVGNLRVIYQIDRPHLKVHVSTILPRGDVYKK